MSNIPSEKELLELRDITRMTGTLTNVQILQLKMWPQIVLGANNAEIEFDPVNYVVTVEVSNLDYHTMMQDTADDPVTIYKRRMAKFDHLIKFLLGDDYSVVVRLNNKIIGQFPAKCPPIKAHPPIKGK